MRNAPSPAPLPKIKPFVNYRFYSFPIYVFWCRIINQSTMKIAASLKSEFNHQTITVQTNDSVKEMNIAVKASGFGSAINGGELLLLSLATCFCNDIYREAAKRNLTVTGVEVAFTGEFGGEGEPGSNFQYTANLISDAPPAAITELIQYTDRIAEIHNTLRKGLDITLNT